jgi:hypothetical protein
MCRRCRAYLRALESNSFEAALLFFEGLSHNPRREPLFRPFRDYSIEYRSGLGTRILESLASEGVLGPWRVVHEGRSVLLGFDNDTYLACLVSPSYTLRDAQMIAEHFGRDAGVMLRHQQEHSLLPILSL